MQLSVMDEGPSSHPDVEGKHYSVVGSFVLDYLATFDL